MWNFKSVKIKGIDVNGIFFTEYEWCNTYIVCTLSKVISILVVTFLGSNQHLVLLEYFLFLCFSDAILHLGKAIPKGYKENRTITPRHKLHKDCGWFATAEVALYFTEHTCSMLMARGPKSTVHSKFTSLIRLLVVEVTNKGPGWVQSHKNLIDNLDVKYPIQSTTADKDNKGHSIWSH